MSATDTEHRRLCHALFDALEQGDISAVDACYASDMTMWVNATTEESSREENLAVLVTGKGLHRRRLYNDRVINTFDDGFVVQYTCNVVTDPELAGAMLVANSSSFKKTRALQVARPTFGNGLVTAEGDAWRRVTFPP